MASAKLTGWNPNLLKKQVMENAIAFNNSRLVTYAKMTIIEIGYKIMSYHSKNGMDRTGNLLNSLCWGVSYKGQLIESGFFRDAASKNKGIDGTSESFLHEWFVDEKYAYPVDGRQLAEEYIRKVGGTGSTGWKVFFAILAPYWGYWEKGFTMRRGGGIIHGSDGKTWKIPRTSTFMKFSVMAEVYDKVKKDLKPARKYYFNVSVPTYSAESIAKRWNKYQEG